MYIMIFLYLKYLVMHYYLGTFIDDWSYTSEYCFSAFVEQERTSHSVILAW